jgi:hypothetical protein
MDDNVVDCPAGSVSEFVDNPVGGASAGPYRDPCPKGPTEARSGGDRLKTAPPGQAEITSMPGRTPRTAMTSGSGSPVASDTSFTSAGQPARAARLDARKDVTGIPVSVLLPGVEALRGRDAPGAAAS